MNFSLPTSVEIQGTEYAIRSDYRCILEICTAVSDPELSNDEKVFAALTIFYPDFEEMPPDCIQEAIERCFWFINGGETEPDKRKAPKLVDWEQDFQYIVAPINRVLGCEVRSVEYLHWWSFLSAYMEIGDCTFAQIVNIRDKKARGKSLDKTEREWYRRNRQLVDFKHKYTDTDQDLMREWSGV